MFMGKFWMRRALPGLTMLALTSALIAQLPAFDGFIDDPADHQFDVFVDSPNWKYFRTASYCYASEENDRGTLLLGFDRRRNAGHLAFWNKDVSGYQTADTTYLQPYLVNIIPGTGVGEPNHDWDSLKFVIAVNRSGQRVFNTRLDGELMLRNFAKYDRIAFVSNARQVVQNFALVDSARAMNRLRTCLPL